MKWGRLQVWFKWLWLAAITMAVGWYLHERRETLLVVLEEFNPLMIFSSLLLLILAKFALSENAFAAAQVAWPHVTRLEVYRLYNLTQLGKYIPGSVWQYVSRSAGYRFAGASYSAIANALLLETLWVLSGAALVGAVLAGPSVLSQAIQSGLFPAQQLPLTASIALGSLVVVVLVAIRFRRRLLEVRQKLVPGPRVFVLQISIWSLLGLSFWILLPAGGNIVPLDYTIGLFAIAYAVGFVTVLAPAGLGVREACLVLGLGTYISIEEALVIVIVARVVYLVAEMLLAVLMLSLRIDAPCK